MSERGERQCPGCGGFEDHRTPQGVVTAGVTRRCADCRHMFCWDCVGFSLADGRQLCWHDMNREQARAVLATPKGAL